MVFKGNLKRKGCLWDIPVIGFVFLAILCPVLFILTDSVPLNGIKKIIDNSIGITGNLYLLIWVTVGHGTKSKLWNWLPPFWPIGGMFKSSEARLIIVILIVLGSILGFLFEIGFI